MSQPQPDPWFYPDRLQAFDDFWRVFEESFDVITDSLVEAGPGPSHGRPDEVARDEGRNILMSGAQAVRRGDWGPFEGGLEALGAGYAQLGVGLAHWTNLILGTKLQLVPRLVTIYGADAERLAGALCAMNRFLDCAVLLASNAYHAAREAAAEEQRALVRKRTTELAESDTRYRLLFESNPLPIWVYDLETQRVCDANEAAVSLLGYSRDELIDKSIRLLAAPDDRPELARRIEAIPHGRRVYPSERILRKDGEIRIVEITSNELVPGQRSPRMIIAKDVTTERRAAEALGRSEARFARLSESGVVGVLLSSFDGRIVEANDAMLKMIGYSREDLRAGIISWEKMTPPEYRAQSDQIRRELLDGGVSMPVEKEYIRKDGSRIWVFVGVAVLEDNSTIALVLDVTERHELAEQLRHAQKMEAIGILAGGVAHDFNNLLSAILGYSDMLLGALPTDSRLHADAREIRRAGERAASLTRQLLAFSRKQMLSPEIINLNDVVAGAERLLRRLIGEDVELVTFLEPALGMVKADSSQIEQVLMNLAVNARDAMPQGGRLSIETTNVEVDAAFARGREGLVAGAYVMLAVTDSGTGMDAATRSRAFEPFFTTKKERGTGLGLSTAFGIARQSGGTMVVESEVGRGTRFEVLLPRTAEAARSTRRPEGAPAAVQGHETILLVEDEPQVRKLARECLERDGYRVLEATGPVHALALSHDHRGSIDLLLTDVVMPQMSGPEVAKRLKKTRPDMKVLCTSGYTDETVVRHGILEAGIAFLQKPYTPDSLLRKVREVLDS
ncbi:MAG TPA: PAS domain S-box protein, partial [Polyangiaceae bacterium]|nr:PAS domain S-box protein [Polyangiaceae bacterium]